MYTTKTYIEQARVKYEYDLVEYKSKNCGNC